MCRPTFCAVLGAVFLLVAGAHGCATSSVGSPSSASVTPAGPLAVVSGLASSEAVVFDRVRDVYFVSNINGDRLSMPPVDASVDTRRGRVGVVSVATDRFELWPWPARRAANRR